LYGTVLFGFFWLFYSSIPRQISDNEQSAELYLCDTEYHIELGSLYPLASTDSLSNDEPKCKDPFFGLPKSSKGYFFEYVGISPTITSEGCRGFKSFTMSARPIVYGRTGFRSFIVSRRSSTVHATSEDRPANSSDPVVRDAINCPRHTPA
jgi:hypothetical protein